VTVTTDTATDQSSELVYKASWAAAGLVDLGEAIGRLVGYESPSANTGATFENDVFVMRAYCWCENEREGHQDSRPPNFVHKATGLKFAWYKWAGRDTTSNVDSMKGSAWYGLLGECFASIEGEEYATKLACDDPRHTYDNDLLGDTYCPKCGEDL